MAANEHESTREDRLAARLRENLRRRKAQARAINNSTEKSVSVTQLDEPGDPPIR